MHVYVYDVLVYSYYESPNFYAGAVISILNERNTKTPPLIH